MTPTVISPTINTDDPNRYKDLVELFNPFTKHAQIDISDGSLPGSLITISDAAAWWPKNWTVDMHMMVSYPSIHLPVLFKLMPSLAIFHAEAQEDLLPIFDLLKKRGIRAGVAITKPVYPGSIKKYIEAADHVMIFSGNLGQNGGTADLLQLEKVRILKRIKASVEIGWDGGANIENVRTIAQAGVNIINVGSALADAKDPAKMFAALSAEVEQQGVV